MVWRLFCLTLFISVCLLGYGIYVLLHARENFVSMPPAYSFGPEDADLSVVEFVDFACSPCQVIHPIIMDAVRKDGHVRYTPLPISPQAGKGIYAMKLAYAAGLQGKFREVYEDLIENPRPVDESSVTDVALKAGIDPGQLKEDAASPKVQAMIDKNSKTYISLNLEFTPTFFIGPKIKYVPPVQPTADDFLRMFAEARGK